MKVIAHGFNKIDRLCGMWLWIGIRKDYMGIGGCFIISTDPTAINNSLDNGLFGFGIRNKFYIGVW